MSMQEGEEPDTCRICSAPAEPDQPLFHPCKCSGTIRYIHQDCLTTWLAHSKKKTCDVCKHPYAFTKVYAPDMPSHLPPLLLIRRLIQQFLLAILFVLRAVAVAIIWLAVLPWVTVWTWRMYFSMGESTAFWIANRPKPAYNSTAPLFQKVPHEAEVAAKNPWIRIAKHPAWVSLSADIFTGQIIAALIVLTFVAVFLLREWIAQNARPGVFEEEEVIPDDPVNMPPMPPMPEPIQPRRVNPGQINALPELAQRQQDAVRALDALRARDELRRHRIEELTAVVQNKGKGKRKANPNDHSHYPPQVPAESRVKYQSRRMRIMAGRAGRTRAPQRPSNTASPIFPPSKDGFNFTFKPFDNDFSPPEEKKDKHTWLYERERTPPSGSSEFESPDSSFFPPVALQPPKDDIPYSIRTWKRIEPLDVEIQATGSSPPAAPSSLAISTSASDNSSESSTGPSIPAPSSEPVDREQGWKKVKSLDYEDFATQATGSSAPLPPVSSSPAISTPLFDSSSEQSTSPSIPLAPSEPINQKPQEDLDRGEGPSQSPKSTEADFASVDEFQPEPSVLWERHDNVEVEDEDDSSFSSSPFPSEFIPRALEFLSDSDETEDESEEANMGHGTREQTNSPPPRLLQIEPDQDDEDEDEDEEVDDSDFFFADEDEVEWDARPEVANNPPPVIVNEVPGQENVAVDNRLQPQQAEAEAGLNPADFNDEFDANVEDDMEGAMEAIGMRGPIYGVFQNAALMVFVLDTAIGLCIWIPFTIGKTTALLTLDVPRFLQILHLPIKAMRLVTDPIVDSIAFIITRFLLPPWIRLLSRLLNLIGAVSSRLASSLLGPETTENISMFSNKLYDQSFQLLDYPLSRLNAWNQSMPAAPATTPIDPEHLFPEFAQPIEPYFVELGKHVRICATALQNSWIHLTLSSGPAGRVFAVFLGYAVFGLLLALYLNLLTVGNARTAGRAVRNAVRQQLLVTKVAGFIFIELVIFPFGCGIVLDICTIGLFPDANHNMQSRLAFFSQAPLTAMFYHWIAGTMFMYSFAVLLSGCRSVMRSGAMWFIKDPQDQNSHPIRDILERPTLMQIRKIAISGVMYSVVVACVVASVAGLLLLGSKSIMPFRWKNREPLSNIPVDLVFLHLVLPQTVHYFRPKDGLKRLAHFIWQFLAAQLRLSSYFFGTRYRAEERPPSERTIFARVPGTFRRVPATDNLALPRDMRATVDVTEEGLPINEEARKLMEQQNAETIKAKHNIETEYTIVYIPSSFRYRIFTFILLLWIVGALLLGFSVALPILLGRRFFNLFTTREVHDGYSLLIGFYLLWGCYLVGRSLDRLDKRRQRARISEKAYADLHVLAIKRGLLWIAKATYMGIFFGVVIPILISFVVDLYVILPIRMSMNPDTTPRIRIVDAWALGLIYGKIAFHVLRINPPNLIVRGLHNISANGWMYPDPVAATKEVIIPLVGALLGMILFPTLALQAARRLLPSTVLDNKMMFMNIYPAIFMLAGLIRSSIIFYDILSTWSQSIRDKEFLVELRLKNHEAEPPKAAVQVEATDSPSDIALA